MWYHLSRMQYIGLVAPLLVSTVILVLLAVYALASQKTPAAIPFVVLMTACAAWALLYALELGGAELAAKVLWIKLRFGPAAVVPVALLMVVFQYTGREEWLTPGRIAILFVEPVVATALGLTSGMHTLFPHDYYLAPGGTSPALLRKGMTVVE